MIFHLLGFAIAFLVSLYGTPIARKAALKFGIVDKPDGHLKSHREPVPYLGGLSIYLAFLLSLSFTFSFSQEVLGIILSGTLVLILGLIDDLGVLSPQVKLVGQFIAIFILIKSGIYIQLAFLPFWLQVTLTVIWLIVLVNAFNLIDVMDGLSAGVACLSALVLFFISALNGAEMIAMMSITLCGSLLGFLRYNFRPAKIFMGDCGSLFVGLMLGALAMNGSYTQINTVAMLAPIFILGVPIFDTFFVSYIRFRRGMSIFKGSQDHFALRLRKWALSVEQTVLLSYGVTLVLGLLGILLIQVSIEKAVFLVGITFLVLTLVGFFLKRIDMKL
ncbi:MAG TPA: MraY family glycosyltransferase [Nitrospiria bacterium]|jgi:UDP-GlcNAc:undecaprenyl-phosphate GlcNAc-1-phosphate transferase